MSWKKFIFRKPTRERYLAIAAVWATIILIISLVDHYDYFQKRPHIDSLERTLVIIKPDAVAAGNAEDIIKQIENNGFKIAAQQQLTIGKATAEQFYAVHKERPFFNDLITYITSGPATVLVLERENAVQVWRNLMGATDPQKADPGTTRQLYGTDIQQNAVHGSDSIQNAQKEIKIFFPDLN
jgi:nucleoside-diphosphate kinase